MAPGELVDRCRGGELGPQPQGGLVQGGDVEVGQVAEGGEGLSLSTIFIPLLRVEKLLLDADSGTAPSLSLQFERRVGRPLREFMGRRV